MSFFLPDPSPGQTPVHILTGFLGSGKTTLLNRLLRRPEMADTAVIVNELGEVGIDHLLVERVAGEMRLLEAGCVCCTVRSDLEDTLRTLYWQRAEGQIPAFRQVVIETTGIADPAPILQMLLRGGPASRNFRVGAVVAVVDAVLGLSTLGRHRESQRQVAVADRLLIGKTDMPHDAAALTAALRALNARAPLLPAADFDGFPTEAGWSGAPPPAACDHDHDHDHGDGHAHHHHDGHGAIASLALSADAPLAWEPLARWLGTLRGRHGEKLLRYKGIFDLQGEGAPVVVHGVQHIAHPPVRLRGWPEGPRRSSLVFVLDGLPAAEIEGDWRALTNR